MIRDRSRNGSKPKRNTLPLEHNGRMLVPIGLAHKHTVQRKTYREPSEKITRRTKQNAAKCSRNSSDGN